MVKGLLLKAILVGLIDSINQTSVAITIYLLGTSRPVIRSLLFIAGIVFAYTLAGYLVYLGLGGFLFAIVTFPHKVQGILGLVFGSIIFATPFFTSPKDVPKKTYPLLQHPFTSLFAGALITFTQIPITLPFLYLIQQLAHDVTLAEIPFFLMVFNLIVTLPLLLLVGGYMIFHETARPYLTWFGNWVETNSTRLLNSGLYLFGFFLIIDAISFLFGHPLFPFRHT
ncbi:MAG: GAP family protein [Chlamydiia bacterium]